MLKDQIEKMMTQLRETKVRLSETQGSRAVTRKSIIQNNPGPRVAPQHSTPFGSMAAVVEEERCIGCGICIDVCQEEAISFRTHSSIIAIDSGRCSCCGMCVHECPNEAMSLPHLRRA